MFPCACFGLIQHQPDKMFLHSRRRRCSVLRMTCGSGKCTMEKRSGECTMYIFSGVTCEMKEQNVTLGSHCLKTGTNFV